MLAKIFKYGIVAILAAAASLAPIAPASALTTDPNRIIPERTCAAGQNVCYIRATVNYNDPRISSGVWFATLPKNAYILSVDAYVTTAFNAGTTNVLTVGATTTANEIVASGITNTAATVTHLTSAAGLGLAVTGSSTYQTQANGAVPVYFKYAQTGTAATAGAMTIVIAFAKNDDN